MSEPNIIKLFSNVSRSFCCQSFQMEFSAVSANHKLLLSWQLFHYIGVQLLCMQVFPFGFYNRLCMMMNVCLNYCSIEAGARKRQKETAPYTINLDSFKCKTSSNKRKSKLRLYFPTNVIIVRKPTAKLSNADNSVCYGLLLL